MILPLLLLSLAGPALQGDVPPPVRVDLNHEQFTRGDRARVYVETAQDGHLVVLHTDPEGRVRVLFPLDPSDDDFVRGGKRVEIRGRSDREAFLVDAGDGSGTVVAVLSPDPLSYEAFVRNDHWDYRTLGAGNSESRDDPLAGLLDIARRMAGETHFEYDAATYVVGSEIASRYGYGSDYYGAGYYGYGYPYRFRLGVSFGYPYGYGYDPFCYDPFWGWSAACSRFGIPRDRVQVTGIEPRRRFGAANPVAMPRGSLAPRGVQPRGRGPTMSPRGGWSRGGSPTMSRPSGGGGRRGGPAFGGT